MKKRFHIFVSGKVQGVGYRDFVRKCAMLLAIGGWAKNLADGRVEIMAEGDDHDMREMLSKLHAGPEDAFVKSLVKEDEQPTGEFKKFEIF